VRDEGFAAYYQRVSEPYRRAIGQHFTPHRPSRTERLLERFAAWRERRRLKKD